MPSPLAQLRIEYVHLAAMLCEAMSVKPGTPGATAVLEETKRVLLIHLNIEQTQVFAPLRKAAAEDPALRVTLESPTAEQAMRRATLLFTGLDLTC